MFSQESTAYLNLIFSSFAMQDFIPKVLVYHTSEDQSDAQIRCRVSEMSTVNDSSFSVG